KEVTINVNKAPLTVKADDKTMNYGGSVPTYTATYTGFVAGDNPSSLGGTLTFTVKDALNNPVTVTNTTPSASYTITPAGLTSANYIITFSTGTLTISPWWTITGFYQPVDMPIPVMMLNVVKGGSTVPLKFNIYAGTPGPTTEKKSVSDVM